ncbi:hypothetical protein ATCC90586_000065 [Pythium insidiosum]|nr:hypothetical protein ATCC90586_000065 [Pythium insidiosum]
MGCSTSHLLNEALYAQPANWPVAATSSAHCSREPTILRIMPPRAFCRDRFVREAVTNQELFYFHDHSFSRTTTLMAPGEVPVIAIKERSFHRQYRVSPFRDATVELFQISYDYKRITAEFRNVVTGHPMRVVLQRLHSWCDRVVLVYLEVDGVRKPIARMHTPDEGCCSVPDEFVEVAPGVDIVLILLLWQVREERRRQQRSSA